MSLEFALCLSKVSLSSCSQIQYQTYENIGGMPNVNDYGFSDGNVPNYVASSASIGPDGYYQTAYIRPENPVSLFYLLLRRHY